MGMDVSRYEIIRTISEKEIPVVNEDILYGMNGLSLIELDARNKKFFNKIGDIDNIRVQKQFDWDAWIAENQELKDHSWVEYCLEEGSEMWASLEDKDGNTILIAEGFKFKEVEVILVEQKEIGYMRKPFRHSDTPTKQKGDSIVITVTNFSEKGLDGFKTLKNIDPIQTEDANVYVFDKKDLESLKKYSYDPEFFQKSFIDDFNGKQYVNFNW